MKLHPSGHEDTFARENLPPFDQWPDLNLDQFTYPERLILWWKKVLGIIRR